MSSRFNRAVQIAGTCLLIAAASHSWAAESTFDRTVAASPRGEIEISNVSGKVVVTGWDKPQVSVHATLDAGVSRVDVLTSDDRVTIKVVLPHMNMRNTDADLDVKVPRGSELEVTTVSAELRTRDVTGEQRLKTVSGGLRADIGEAAFEAKTVSGDIVLRGGSGPIDMRISSVSGDITLDHAAGEVDAMSVSGDVHVEVSPASSVRLHSTSGDLGFRGKLTDDANLEAETVSGDVVLVARSDAGYEYAASSFSGDITNCFDKEARTSSHGPGSRLMGTEGKGGGRIRVKSMSGDVSICDR